MSIQELKDRLAEIKKIDSIGAVLHWDQETYMPEGAGDARAEHISYLSTLAHRLHTGEEFRNCLKGLVNMETGEPLQPQTDADTHRMLYLAWKDYRDVSTLPADFVKELALLTSKSQQVWQKARVENDFNAFAPYLEKIIDFKRKEAEYYGYTTTPYDALIDKFEPGMNTEKITILFNRLKEALVQLVKDIREKGTPIDDKPMQRSFDVDKQWEFGLKVAEVMGYDFTRGRQDKSAHPFTTTFHPTDVRITTRLLKNNFKTAIFSTIHETGHALYEQGLRIDDYGSPLGEPISFGIHESQSRIWENIIGRSRDFWYHFYPQLTAMFSRPLVNINLDRFYKMINTVKPSLIRVEADEVTYSLHIMLRFEIEALLIDGKLEVKDLPAAWDQKMEEFLGVRPEDYKDGVLQDVHWSMGAFGYFPSYALGNLYGAMMVNRMQKDIPELSETVKNGNLPIIREWLRNNVHSVGHRMDAEELIQKLTGESLSAEPFIHYLEKKYRDIYALPNK